MLADCPQWLADVLHDAEPKHGRLSVARLCKEGMVGKGGLSLSSAAFSDGEALDPCFTSDEEDSVAPPLEWTAPPSGTLEMVLIVEDPDVPAPAPFCHWAVWGLKAQKGQILEGEIPQRVGKNARGNSEWLLPDLPVGEDSHDFVFQLFALDMPIVLMPGATREELLDAMDGSVISVAVMTGTYASEEGGVYDFDDELEDEKGAD